MARKPYETMFFARLWILTINAAVLAYVPIHVHAQQQFTTNIAATPKTSSQGLGTVADTKGNTTVITGGTPVGPNLFHSFDSFNLGTKAVAQFQNNLNLPKSGTNIFARVIGGNQSQIDGTIQTSGFGNANVWFMNPQGFLFGPNAHLDIGGAAGFTTADTLYLRDQNNRTCCGRNERNFQFDTSMPATGTFGVSNFVPSGPLAVHPIASFGFSGPAGAQPIGITISESNISIPGNSLAFVAGNIQVDGGNLSATNGAVRITSVGPIQQSVEASPQAFVNVNEAGVHSYAATGNCCQPHGAITLAQSSNRTDTVITGSTIQLNGVTYNGTNATGYIGTDLTARGPNGEPPVIVIKDGSLQVANLPSTQLIVSSPAVTSVAPETSLDVGGNANLTVTLNHAYTSPVRVTVQSDNTNVASVSPTVAQVEAGKNTSSVQVHGVSVGNTSVRGTYGNTSAAVPIHVGFPVNQLLPNPATLTEGDGGALTVTLSRLLSQPVTVSFTSSNPSVLGAPRTITIQPGQTTGTTSFQTFQSGSATITAALQVGGQTIPNSPTTSIQVNAIPVSSLAPNLSITEGTNGALNVSLAKTPPHPVTINFTSSRPDIVPAPNAVTIPANAANPQATVPVRAVQEGQAIITASYATGSATASVQVNAPNPPAINSLLPNLSIQSNTAGILTVTLANTSTRDVRVVFNSSDNRIARPEQFVVIPAGQTVGRISVQGLTAGNAIITAGDSTSTATANVQVFQPPISLTQSQNSLTDVINNSAIPNVIAAAKLKDPQTRPVTPTAPTQLVMASDRCVGSKAGEFSSFAQRGRDAAPPQPGGLLPSPLRPEHHAPRISGLSVAPLSIEMRRPGTLSFAPGVAAFLDLGNGC
jgi:filamentous hemagglutinin family protein